jgi:formate/nitrite transporter FocA (FNT family)
MGGHEEAADTRRLTVPEIFDAAVANAREEVKCSVGTLAFSGIAGGMTMGLSGLGVAAVRSLVSDGGWQELVSDLIYPAGFIAVMIGRAQ